MSKKTTPPNAKPGADAAKAAKATGAVVPGTADVAATGNTSAVDTADLATTGTLPVVAGHDAQDGISGSEAGASDDAANKVATGTPPAADLPDTLRPYIVRSVSIRHNGKVYGPGADIDLASAEAARLHGAVMAAKPFVLE